MFWWGGAPRATALMFSEKNGLNYEKVHNLFVTVNVGENLLGLQHVNIPHHLLLQFQC